MAKTEIDWAKIRAEYISGNESCREIAARWNLSPNVVSKKATKEGWKNDRRKCGEKAAEKIVTRSARARADAALQGLDLVKYTMDLWNDNLKALNETIHQTPEYMLSNPSFASGIARGLQTTYELLLKMSGEGEKERRMKLRLEKEKLELERQKQELERQRLAIERENLRAGAENGNVWEIIEDTEGSADG